MASLQGPRELFIHELAELLSAEQTFAQALPELQQAAQNPQLREGFRKHETETQQQIQNLQQAIQQLGAQAPRVTCQAAEGLRQDFMTLKQQKPSPAVLEMAAVAAGTKTEHLEIASYRGLLTKARLMGEREIAQLLQQNLEQEERTARRLETMGETLAQQALGASRLGRAQDTAAQI